MTIAIIGAMPEEISAIQAQLTDVRHQLIGSVNFYQGRFAHTDIVLACSGIGKVHGALATTLMIEHYQPSCIINVGTLGALHKHLKPATIILSESVLYHDVDVTSFGNYVHGQLPKMPPDYQSSHALVHLFETLALKQNLAFEKGVGITGDQFIACTAKLHDIKTKFPAALGIDMEAAAIAHIAHLFAVPFVSVRAITDHADEQAAATSDQHLMKASDIVGHLVLSALDQIDALLD
jgi:adenosylhomocysteine nucleosidase